MPFWLFGETRCAVYSPAPKCSLVNRLEMKMHAKADASPESRLAETKPTWPEEIFAILQRFDVRQVPYVPDAGHSN